MDFWYRYGDSNPDGPVELLLRKLSEGASEADLLDAYPHLTREDIHAAMRYAVDTLAHEEIVFIPGPSDALG